MMLSPWSRWQLFLIGACNAHRESLADPFHLKSGSFGAATGCSGSIHTVCKLPLKWPSGESWAVAQHTMSATIQGQAGYVQHTPQASTSSPVSGCTKPCYLIARSPCRVLRLLCGWHRIDVMTIVKLHFIRSRISNIASVKLWGRTSSQTGWCGCRDTTFLPHPS
jgi:hypothetical protein